MPSFFIIPPYIYYLHEGLHCYITMDPIPWFSKYKGRWSKAINFYNILCFLQKEKGLPCEAPMLCSLRCSPLLYCMVHFALRGIFSTGRSTKIRFLGQNLAKLGCAQQATNTHMWFVSSHFAAFPLSFFCNAIVGLVELLEHFYHLFILFACFLKQCFCYMICILL